MDEEEQTMQENDRPVNGDRCEEGEALVRHVEIPLWPVGVIKGDGQVGWDQVASFHCRY